jgi:hypothetical protein
MIVGMCFDQSMEIPIAGLKLEIFLQELGVKFR